MIILGIVESHCSTACLMKDGRIVGMVQEERLTKRKNQVALPKRAIEALIGRDLDGDASRLDQVVFAEKIVDPYGIALDRYSDFSVLDHVREQHRFWHPYFYGEGLSNEEYWREEFLAGRWLNQDHNHDLDFIRTMPWKEVITHFSTVERPAALKRHFGWEGPVTDVDHHECHAYYALYGHRLPSELRGDALVLTADAWGEGRNWSAWVAEPDGRLEQVGTGARHRVARLYKFVTLILGMKPNEHEYKVMGLAPYSRSRKHVEAAERVFFETLDFRDGAFVSDRPLKDSYFDLKERLEGHRFDNVATALQNWASALTCAWARHWLRETGRRTLCFSGGLSMNIRINGNLLDLPEVEWLGVPPSGGDESLAAGACFAERAEAGATVTPLSHVYLGDHPDAFGDNWRRALSALGKDCDDFAVRAGVDARAAARLLAENCIVARCVGPAEFGARALGNRSILANPSNPGNVKVINDAIKNRDIWMPFTPSILAEHAARYLENPKDICSPYMTIGFRSRPEHRDEIVAALHSADWTVRPQFVERETNPEYWRLIEEFRQLTGIPALLNTSLNLHGEPLNYTVADAARTMALSELDFLLLPGERLLYKMRAAARLDAVLAEPAAA